MSAESVQRAHELWLPGMERQGYADEMNRLLQSFITLTVSVEQLGLKCGPTLNAGQLQGPKFDPHYEENQSIRKKAPVQAPATKPSQPKKPSEITIPDLSDIPIDLLEVHVACLRKTQEESSTKSPKSTPSPKPRQPKPAAKPDHDSHKSDDLSHKGATSLCLQKC